MRKKTIKCGIDTIFWYIIYLLPIILTVIQSIGVFENFTFADWEYIYNNTSVTDYDFIHLLSRNLDVLGFTSMPSEFSSVSDFFESLWWIRNDFGPVFMRYMWYFIFCNIVHLLVDFILFIPRLCHKWMNAFTRTED